MLEEKIKSVRLDVVLPLVASLSLAAAYNCGDGPQPSKECCNALQCGEGEELYRPVCDGDGDDCYCRSKSCCEEKDCGTGYSCIEGDTGGCICQKQSTGYDKY